MVLSSMCTPTVSSASDRAPVFAVLDADVQSQICYRVEELGECQAFMALYSERITEDAKPLFPINSLRNQVHRKIFGIM